MVYGDYVGCFSCHCYVANKNINLAKLPFLRMFNCNVRYNDIALGWICCIVPQKQ